MKNNAHKAPDAKVTLSDGTEKHLREFWQDCLFAAFRLTVLPRAGGAVAPQSETI